jgi:hypothetical protein
VVAEPVAVFVAMICYIHALNSEMPNAATLAGTPSQKCIAFDVAIAFVFSAFF